MTIVLNLVSLGVAVVLLFPVSAAAQTPADKGKTLPWLATLAAGGAEAQRQRQPILVRFSGESCPWCRKLEVELARPSVQEELARWTLVALDVDRADREARALAVGAIPALRVLTPTGRLVVSKDGYLEADRLVAWLKKHYETAAAPPDEELTASGPPDALAVARLVGEFKARDAVVREAAVRRLLPHPDLAAAPVVEAFAQGSLQTRLTALELLQAWKAPVAAMDPWHPETLTAARLKALRAWTSQAAGPAKKASQELTAAELASARAEIAHMLKAADEEASAGRERLARHGRALLPEVYAQFKQTTVDLARERLTALRYRLVASDALALTWRGGLERLAATAAGPRQQAVQELVARATAADEPLLLELFSNPDPLVRELSLRALKEVAGPRATPALTRLLNDPEPNVRAAVLKHLAEQPSKALVATIVAYARGEKDADLVVHAVRALRAVGGPSVTAGLKDLLKHESWQVRAEAAEALAKAIDRYNQQNQANNADICVALVELLDDPDGFVVSRAIPALAAADLALAVEPLVRAAAKHPDLAPVIVRTLSNHGAMGATAIPHLRSFCRHADPEVRAAAIGGLCGLVLRADSSETSGPRSHFGSQAPPPIAATPESIQGELRSALLDRASQVRQAAGEAIFSYLEKVWGAAFTTGEIKADELEAWLAKYQAGKDRPAWLAALIELLQGNLGAATPEERLAAALPLVALGREEKALPVLLEATKTEPALQGKASAVLRWLAWPKRLASFNRLLEQRPDPDQLRHIVQNLVAVRDRRGIARLWEILAGDASVDSAGVFLDGLEQLYFGGSIRSRRNNILAIAAADQKEAAGAARPRAESGPEAQRLVALALLLPAAPDGVVEIARKVMSDRKAGPLLRRDAFQVILLAQSKAEARRTTTTALAHGEPAIRELAATFLARGFNEYSTLHDGKLYVHPYDSTSLAGSQPSTGRVIVSDAAQGLKPEMLRPLLRDANPKTAAHAAYLLALLQDAAGLDLLVRYWRAQAPDNDEWSPLVYGAVAALNDDSKVPLLEEIYRSYVRNQVVYLVPRFYWTIRVMDGPRALRLRKLIEREIGVGLGIPVSQDFPQRPGVVLHQVLRPAVEILDRCLA